MEEEEAVLSSDDENNFPGIENYYDVIISYKCKLCPFLSQNKSEFCVHFRRTHALKDMELERRIVEATMKKKSGDNEARNVLGEPKLTLSLGTTEVNVNESSSISINETPTLSNLFDGTSGDTIGGKEIFLCSECNIAFHSKDVCRAHMNQKHNILNFSFSEVELIDLRKKEENVQQSKVILPPNGEAGLLVNNNNLHHCTKCSSKFESDEIRQFHEECHCDKGFACRICEVTSSSEHILSDTYFFPTWKRCTWHLWKQHKIDCQLHSCSHLNCDFKSNFLHKVREHESIHLPKCNFQCDICRKSFKQLKQLQTHQKYHKQKNSKLAPPADSRWYTTKECPICKRILSDSKCLKKHIAAVHNKLKPHTCNICNHQTARKAELELHMRQHTGDKPFRCSTCPFVTRDHNSLRRHQLRHSDQKTYNCKLCPYKCIQSSGFKKHIIAKHPDEDVDSIFVCPYCPLVSVNKEIYESHIKDHNDGRISSQENREIDQINNSRKSQKETNSFINLDESSSNSSCTRSTSRYWIRDDDSIDQVVDTGGITIPAQSSSSEDTEIVTTIPLTT